MNHAKHLIESKGNEIWSIGPDATVLDAISLMAEKRIGALLVMNDNELQGVFSERDYARKVVLRGKSSRKTAVSEIMSSEVVTADPSNSVEECMSLMTENRVRHLPVVTDNQVVGVLSIGDLVKAIIDEQQFKIEQLENFITTGY
ncbi:MAG: CBS domain-containing protein [Acidobacteriota bacterium]|nr:CBS domain-containing protein [Acidobacteriota bacterium]MDH3531132.1 CBS domain-containing protein [Acidobacteriota bacterium]